MKTLSLSALAIAVVAFSAPAFADNPKVIRDGAGAPIKQMYTSTAKPQPVKCQSGEFIRDGAGGPVCQMYTDDTRNVVAGDFDPTAQLGDG